ncbi:hypothetical protein BV133_2790 [Blastochloris viridis]|uniref:SnoaL-like domain-containing protein n=1 Tax=Blastochloris viridis TaxID=1079 RepID=A0A182D5D6_BLAVI|nr:hypothetical protein BV133_2790 [Blastochloris viridis]
MSGDPETVPLAGDYRGAAGVMAFLARLDATARVLMPTLQDLLIDGDCAVVRWTMPVRSGSVQAELQCVDILRLRQHRIMALEQVFDTSAAAKLFGTQTLPRTLQPDPVCQNGAAASAVARDRPGDPGS